MLNAKYQLALGAALVMTAATAVSVAVAPAARAAGPQLCNEAGFEIWRGGAGLAVTQFGLHAQ